MHPVNQPEVMVPYVEDKVDRAGRITDVTAREKVRVLLESLVAWTLRLRAQQYAHAEAL
jgi:chromate reductase